MLRIVIMLAAMLLALVGPAPAAANSAVHAPRVHVVVIDKMAFGAMPAGVRAGDIIEWVNHDILEHSATARNGSFDVDLKPGASARTEVKKGVFPIFCKFHPTMQASLIVK